MDKAPGDFQDDLILEWKRTHVKRIAAVFGAVEYANRHAVRNAIEPVLAQNRVIFNEYGPDNIYRFDPESEVAQAWQRKVLSHILPNNRKILSILDKNRHLLIDRELITLEHFRQHVDDLEARHLGGSVAAVGRRFPAEMEVILAEACSV